MQVTMTVDIGRLVVDPGHIVESRIPVMLTKHFCPLYCLASVAVKVDGVLEYRITLRVTVGCVRQRR